MLSGYYHVLQTDYSVIRVKKDGEFISPNKVTQEIQTISFPGESRAHQALTMDSKTIIKK